MADGSRSSTGVETPAWVRMAMPSGADLIFVALLGTLVFTPLLVRLLGDAGIGWHIRTGQQILATHTIPRVDSFSSTMAGKPWFAWEWLYDLAVGQLEATLGLNGVVWFTAVVIAAVFAWMFRLLITRGTNLLVALVLVLLAVSASMIHFLARPHVVSWLFTLAWFWILDSSERHCFDGRGQGGRWLWALPLLILVWVNVHGGFLVGFVLLAIFLLGAAWTWFRAREGRIEEVLQKIAAEKRVRNLVAVGLLSVAASLVNPYGWKLYFHVYHYLSNRFLMDHIEEFQSPNFHGIAQKCFLVLLLITVAVLTARGRELRMSEGLTVLFAVYAGLYASRNIPVSSVLLVMVVGPLVPAVGLARGFSQRMSAVEAALRGHVWPIVAILVTLSIAANGGRAGSSVQMDAHFDPKRMPEEAVNYLEKQELKGPVLSPDYWGGYLIYRLYPKSRVVVDDRHDLYGEEFFKSYLKMIRIEPGWEEFLRMHESSCVLLPRDSALASIMSETKGWRQIYADDVAIAFVRDPVNP
ncbi:MAG: hypothetical protein WB781_25550 [Candidatus Sulfotelmatobacter sp.]